MFVTEMFFTPLQQKCQMWQKQLSENLVCIEFNKFCYADEILELTVPQYNSFKSNSLLATYFFRVFSGRKSTASLFRLPQNILLGN